jgi:glycosyltransferase involved in cell wall biosynthesis
MRSMLFLTPELPYPPVSGGKIKSWKLVQHLSRHYRLALACPLKENDQRHLAEFESKAELAEFLHEPLQVPRSARNLAISYLRGVPLNIHRTDSSRLRRAIDRIAADYDLIFCDHYEVFQYVPEDYRGKVILHEHNAYFLMWYRYAERDGNLLLRLASYLEYLRVRRYEVRACARADRVFASPNDIDALVTAGVERGKCGVTYHLGDETHLQCPPLDYADTELSLLYVGTLSWEANIDGLLWFLQQVWPLLRQRQPALRLQIAGGNPDARLQRAVEQDTNLELCGFVDDLEPLFQRNRVFIAPLRFGAGIKVKVLTAMGRGIPTVTTSVGSEGLQAESMRHLAIADDPEPMAEAIDRLLTDQTLWDQLAQGGRQLVLQHYTWEQTLGSMQRELDDLTWP